MIATLATLPPPVLGALGLMLGIALGLWHFATLRRVSALYLSGTATLRALALQGLRLALLAAILYLLARIGALALISGAAGLMIGRAIVLRRTRGRA